MGFGDWLTDMVHGPQPTGCTNKDTCSVALNTIVDNHSTNSTNTFNVTNDSNITLQSDVENEVILNCLSSDGKPWDNNSVETGIETANIAMQALYITNNLDTKDAPMYETYVIPGFCGDAKINSKITSTTDTDISNISTYHPSTSSVDLSNIQSVVKSLSQLTDTSATGNSAQSHNSQAQQSTDNESTTTADQSANFSNILNSNQSSKDGNTINLTTNNIKESIRIQKKPGEPPYPLYDINVNTLSDVSAHATNMVDNGAMLTTQATNGVSTDITSKDKQTHNNLDITKVSGSLIHSVDNIVDKGAGVLDGLIGLGGTALEEPLIIGGAIMLVLVGCAVVCWACSKKAEAPAPPSVKAPAPQTSGGAGQIGRGMITNSMDFQKTLQSIELSNNQLIIIIFIILIVYNI